MKTKEATHWDQGARVVEPEVAQAMSERHGKTSADFSDRLWWAMSRFAANQIADGIDRETAINTTVDLYDNSERMS